MSASVVVAEPNVVRLNVGGTLFCCNVQTLAASPPGVLQRMFSGDDASVELQKTACRDDAGNIFFDRDPAAFWAILEYIRTGNIVAPDGVDSAAVIQEYIFFIDPSLECDGDNIIGWSFDVFGPRNMDPTHRVFFEKLQNLERDGYFTLENKAMKFVHAERAFGRWLQDNKKRYPALGSRRLIPLTKDFPFYHVQYDIVDAAFADFSREVLAYMPYTKFIENKHWSSSAF